MLIGNERQSNHKIHGCKISIVVKFEEMSDGDESDKHLEARDRRYSCLKMVRVKLSHFHTVQYNIANIMTYHQLS